MTFLDDPYRINVKDVDYTINSLFIKNDFDLNYDPDKYWLQDDCDKSINKRPEYQQGFLY